MDILNDILEKSSFLEETKDFNPANFKKNYINKRKPVLLKGYASKWPAAKKWDLDFLSDLEFNKSVRIEVGNVIQNETNVQRANFKTFIESLKTYKDTDKDKPYLSMFNLFDYFPDLKNDVDLSILTNYTKYNHPGAWIGPSGTITGFHWDSTDNILTQLKGRKLLVIASPKFKKQMYTSKKYDYDAIASQVDINNYDEKKFPMVKHVEFKKLILEPGDTVFIPRGWWHYVKSLDTSISVSNFGHYRKGLTYYKEFIEYRLHLRGLYKNGDCTCHKVIDGKRVVIGRS
ncbi:MAG: cupin-like domain-containing protein [Ignavibacteriae bacterium]|nr:cupin-like domain-containing protein [Ignavibacteriota bacterium]MCB0753054.1 cupin-like domain-containing protein [Ignavibacteriota bacterium]